MRTLKRVKQRFGEKVTINIFGCGDEDINVQQLERDFEFNSHGCLIRQEVAELFRSADIFLDLSDYQAFGRAGLEAMACGCAVVLPVEGGVDEYAANRENALLVDTASENACYGAVTELISDSDFRKELKNSAVLKATEYSIHKAAISELTVLKKKLSELKTEKVLPHNYLSLKPGKIKVLGILQRTQNGNLAGSSYIRIFLPLSHLSVSNSIDLNLVTEDELLNLPNIDIKPDILVVQRAAISDITVAHKLLAYSQQQAINTVYETDDNLFDIPTGKITKDYNKSLQGAKIFAMNADMVTVSSDQLKDKITKLNKNVQVIPNALDEQLWLTQSSPKNSALTNGNKLRILYMGTRTHLKDLLLVEDAMRIIHKEYKGKVVLDVIGIIPDSYKQEWFNVVSVPRRGSSNYPEFVQWLCRESRWSIGIAPLENTEFNRCKSYIKYLDYSALGLATICSDLEPYREVVKNEINGFLVDNSTESWYKAIKRLIDDEHLRTVISNNAYQNFLKNHTLNTQAKTWLGTYRHLFNQK